MSERQNAGEVRRPSAPKRAVAGRHGRGQRGMVLLLVMGVLAVVSTLIYGGLSHQRLLLKKVGFVADMQQARLAALAALESTKFVILLDTQSSDIDHLQETWALPAPVDVEGASVFVQIKDVGQRWNLNALTDSRGRLNRSLADVLANLFQAYGQGDEVIGEIIDWVDADDTLSDFGNGRERGDYIAGGYAYGPRNNAMHSMDEVKLLPAWAPEQAHKLWPLLTVSAACADSRLNLNTASENALLAMAPLLSATEVSLLLSERQQAPFESLADALTRISFTGDVNRVATLATVSSDCFEINVNAKVNQTTARLHAQIHRSGGMGSQPTVKVVDIQWQN